ncbi:protein Bouncer-like [Sphaeramia orbicularis]|uniref:protein Bouncer-like n=1 Tax=Sphaeramia orbicularis TaxID=375764 RepID=UPI00117EDB1C|nr:protein Bouncer-like [Sphaeramia orbicularis]
MNSLWNIMVFLCVFVPAAQCLKCQQCPISIVDACLFGKEVTCNNQTEKCFRGQAKFNATEGVVLYIRGCLDSDLCEKTITGQFLGSGYSSRFTCCNTTLCNGATLVQISVMAAIGTAVLSSVWTAWGV